jgi:ABC-2 type transport system permease protein
MFRDHVIWAVWKRNVASYFSGVLGYLFIAVFVVAASVLAFNDKFFVENQCNLDQLSNSFPWLLLFIVPAVTMTLWAEERKLGTDELLFTLPASDAEILAGKYFAAVSIYTIALLFSGTLTFVLARLGDPDWSVLFSTYFGYWLAGSALLAAGMFASSLTSSATVAFILGVLFAAIPVGIDVIGGGQLLDWFGIRESLSIGGQLKDFTTGLIPLGGLAYFIALAAFFLYLNSITISRRHWATGADSTKLGWQFFVRALCLGVVLLSGTYVLATIGGRADMTSEKLYTLSAATRKVIDNIDPKKPVMLQAYVSPRMPEDYVTVRKNLMTLLRQFQKLGGSKLDVRIIDTDPFSKQAEEAAAGGIERREVVSERGGRYTRDDIYLGLVASSGYDRVVIPYFEKVTPVEFELTRAIGTVSKEKRPTVGVLTTDAKVMGGMDMSSFRQSAPWRLATELRKQYTVKEISPDSEIADDSCDVLMAMLPSSLTQPQMENFVKYVKRGRPVLIFDDPAPVFLAGGLELAPSSPNKPSQGGGMFGGGQPGAPKADGGEALTLMDALGVNWNVHDVMFDFANPHPEISSIVAKTFLFINAERNRESESGLNPEAPITAGLQEVLIPFGGQFRQKNDSKFTFTPLLRSRKGSSGAVDFDKIFKKSGFPFGGGGMQFQERILDFEKPDTREHIVGAQIQSTDKANPVNAIFIADVDLVANQVYQFWESETAGLSLDNILFVYNCVDALAGNTDYIALRNRRAAQRSLTGIDAEKKKFIEVAQEQSRAAEFKATESLDAAKKRMQDEINKLKKDKSLDAGRLEAELEIITQREQRRLDLESKEIERARDEQVRLTKATTERNVRAIEDRTKLWAWCLPPIPAVILGLIMLLQRLAAEQKGISSERQVRR